MPGAERSRTFRSPPVVTSPLPFQEPWTEEARGPLVGQIVKRRTVHTFIENEVMYPEVRKLLPELEDDVLQSYEEHHVADRCAPTVPAAPTWRTHAPGSIRASVPGAGVDVTEADRRRLDLDGRRMA